MAHDLPPHTHRTTPEARRLANLCSMLMLCLHPSGLSLSTLLQSRATIAAIAIVCCSVKNTYVPTFAAEAQTQQQAWLNPVSR